MKKLITFLGNSRYKECYYTFNGKESKNYTRFVQTAIYELFCSDFTEEDEVYVFITKESKENNWENSHPTSSERPLIGLKETFESMTPKPKAKITAIEISSGQSEQENWELFEKIVSVIGEGDEIYFDITNAFRSFPIMAVIIMSYAKFLKKASLGRLLYGCFEELSMKGNVDHMPPEERKAPINDISTMVSLFEWTNGVDSFIRTGDASIIRNLTNLETTKYKNLDEKAHEKEIKLYSNLTNQLDQFSKAIATCRGKNIHRNIHALKVALKKAKKVKAEKVRPLAKLFDEVEKKLDIFTDDEIINYLDVAKWCKQHNLIQQGYTFLFEGVITILCVIHRVSPYERKNRVAGSEAINSIKWTKTIEDWGKYDRDQIELIQKMMEYLQPYKEILKEFYKLNDYRNDINHAQMNKGKLGTATINSDFESLLVKLEPLFLEVSLQYKKEEVIYY